MILRGHGLGTPEGLGLSLNLFTGTPKDAKTRGLSEEGRGTGHTDSEGEKAWNTGAQLPASAPYCILGKTGARPLGPDYFLRAGRATGSLPTQVLPKQEMPGSSPTPIPGPWESLAWDSSTSSSSGPASVGNLACNRACVTLGKVVPLLGPQAPAL